MAKQGQHNHDDRDQDVSKGHNNPDKSVTITTGGAKQPETYKQQAAEHKATDKQAQADKNEWVEDTRTHPTSEDKVFEPKERTGSDSKASSGTRGH